MWGLALVNAVTRRLSVSEASHTLTTCIIDDTNLKLSQTVPEATQWKVSRVVSIMNNVQSLIVGFEKPSSDAEGSQPETHRMILPIHTAPAILPKADKETLCAEFLSRIFMFCGSTANRFQIWNISRDLLDSAKIQGLTVCCDALPTNFAVVKQIRLASVMENRKHGDKKVFPLLAIPCTVHQLALARKPLLQGIPDFWSSIVRLSHLFEVHSFRVHFPSSCSIAYDLRELPVYTGCRGSSRY